MMKTRPVLRYHGGKWRLAPWIISHFPEHRVYVESFGGAASILLRKPRAHAEIYNDLDSEIVSLFRVLRDMTQARELIRLLRLTPFARDEFELSYIAVDDPIEQARRTILRSLAGYGGKAVTGCTTGFRANSNLSGTTPAHDWVNYPDKLLTAVERLRGVVIENRPAIAVIEQHDGLDTLHYCDPPYVHSTRSERHDTMYRHEMIDDQHRALAQILHSVQGMVIISGYPCELYDVELYSNWQRIEREALTDGARERIEVLWLSPNTSRKLACEAHQLKMNV